MIRTADRNKKQNKGSFQRQKKTDEEKKNDSAFQKAVLYSLSHEISLTLDTRKRKADTLENTVHCCISLYIN